MNHIRSIPACTGNPVEGELGFDLSQVYPRVYGESLTNSLFVMPSNGLSPRVRGIRIGRSRT